MIKVVYFMKGEAMQCREFFTLWQAQNFMQSLADDPNCESYGIERRAS